MSDIILKYEYKNGSKQVLTTHPMIRNWLFEEGEEDQALLAHHMAVLAEKNGMSGNDMMHLFPAVLRILRCSGRWAE